MTGAPFAIAPGGIARAGRRRMAAPAGAAGLVLLAAVALGQERRMNMWGTPPTANPKFQKSAAAVMMGPMPLLTQRRSEQKRSPAPPKIVGNLFNFGFEGWQGSPGSVDALLSTSKKKIEMWYGWEHVDVSKVVSQHEAGERIRVPILYLCVYYPMKLTDGQRLALANYVANGGTLLVNCCGQPQAFQSVKTELAAMFPKRPLRLLPPDHPVYRSHFSIEQVNWPSDMAGGKFKNIPGVAEAQRMGDLLEGGLSPRNLPRLHGVTVGTRAAAIVSFEDMACGWNQWENNTVPRYSLADSNAIGVNIMTYALAELRFARFLAATHEIQAPDIRPRQQLILVQLIHDGNWDPNPSGVPYLLRHLSANTSIAVKFARRRFELRNPDLFAYPMLYMTGTWNPNLSPAEKAILHRYLGQGGCLIADSASGRLEFDSAIRELAAELFPEHSMRKLPPDHAVFDCFYRLDELYTNHKSRPIPPELEIVTVNNRPVILYSPLGLCDGWALEHSAYARAYQPDDAFKLATNMITYMMLTVREDSGE